MIMLDCPQYNSCAANVCPLDSDWRRRTHTQGDPICLFLREDGKPTADEELNRNEVFKEIRTYVKTLLAELRAIKARCGDEGMPRGLGNVLYQYDNAYKSGSSLAAFRARGERLREAKAKKDEQALAREG